MYHLDDGFRGFKNFTMSTARGYFVLTTCAAALLLVSQTVSKLPPPPSFCSADHFCDGDEGYVTETTKEENLQEKKKRESEENEKEEMVRQQYEDFPSPEVTLKQLEDEKLR